MYIFTYSCTSKVEITKNLIHNNIRSCKGVNSFGYFYSQSAYRIIMFNVLIGKKMSVRRIFYVFLTRTTESQL